MLYISGATLHNVKCQAIHVISHVCIWFNGLGLFVDVTEKKSLKITSRQNKMYTSWKLKYIWMDGLVQDCAISIANALEILQSWTKPSISSIYIKKTIPDGKVHVANMGPTWVLSSPGGPHVDPMNLALRGVIYFKRLFLNLLSALSWYCT